MSKNNSLAEKAAQINSELDDLMKECFEMLPLSSLGEANDEEVLMLHKIIKLYEQSKEYMMLQSQVLDQINTKLDKLVEK